MNKIIVNTDIEMGKANKDLYGCFSEHLGHGIYEGIYVGVDSDIPNINGIRSDVVQLLKDVKVPLLRWPGGCFADEYHWKDGIGPLSERKSTFNSHWGGVVENNHFGTHEFFELCEQVGCEAYVNLNVGSGSIKEMKEWIEYMTMPGQSPMADLRRKNGRDEPFKVKYLGIGNENWGCGGNMCADYYANVFNRYSTFARQYGDEMPYIVAGGANVDDYNWTDTMMKRSMNHFDGVSLHYYTIPGDWETKGDATNFSEAEWYKTMEKVYDFDEIINVHSSVMNRYDPKVKKGLIIDEWGTWLDVTEGTNPGFLEQESTMRDALVASLHLNMFHKYNKRVHMCTIAQTVNVLQSLIMTKGEQVKKTPTYYAFKMYENHIENTVINCYCDSDEYINNDENMPFINSTATKDKNGEVTVSISNIDMNKSQNISLEIRGDVIENVVAEILTSEDYNDFNSFENEQVKISDFDKYTIKQNQIELTIPKHSIITIKIK